MTDLFWPGDARAGALMSDRALLTAMESVEYAWLDALAEYKIAPPEAQAEAVIASAAIPANHRSCFPRYLPIVFPMLCRPSRGTRLRVRMGEASSNATTVCDSDHVYGRHCAWHHVHTSRTC